METKFSDRLTVFVVAGLIVVFSVLLVSKTADNRLAVFGGVAPNTQVAGIGMPPPQLTCMASVYRACMRNPWYFGFPVSFQPGDYSGTGDFCLIQAQMTCSGLPLPVATTTPPSPSGPSSKTLTASLSSKLNLGGGEGNPGPTITVPLNNCKMQAQTSYDNTYQFCINSGLPGSPMGSCSAGDATCCGAHSMTNYACTLAQCLGYEGPIGNPDSPTGSGFWCPARK